MGNGCGAICCTARRNNTDRWVINEDRNNTTLTNAEIKDVQLLWDEVVSKGYDIELGIQALRGIMSRYPQIVSSYQRLSSLSVNTVWIKEAHMLAFVHAMMQALSDVINYLDNDREVNEYIQAQKAAVELDIRPLYLRTGLEAADEVTGPVLGRRLQDRERRAWRSLLQFLFEQLSGAPIPPLRESSWTNQNSQRKKLIDHSVQCESTHITSMPTWLHQFCTDQDGMDVLPNDEVHLDEQDTDHVKKLWKHIKAGGDDIEFGFDFFREILSWYPKTVYNFPISKADRLACDYKWYKDALFISWVKDFMKKVGLVVMHLNDEKKLTWDIEQISARFKELKFSVRHVKLGMDIWNTNMNKYIPKRKFTEERRISWSNFIKWLFRESTKTLPAQYSTIKQSILNQDRLSGNPYSE